MWKIASIALLAIAVPQTNYFSFLGKMMNHKNNNSQIAKTMQSQVKDIDRIHEQDLEVTTYVNKYVKTGTPVIPSRGIKKSRRANTILTLKQLQTPVSARCPTIGTKYFRYINRHSGTNCHHPSQIGIGLRFWEMEGRSTCYYYYH